MQGGPKRQGSDNLIREIHAQLLEVQRSYRDKIIQELPAPLCAGSPDTYVLEAENLPFSPQIYREICLRLAPLLTEHNPQADFIPLLSRLSDVILKQLATALQQAPELDITRALELSVEEIRLHRLSPLDNGALHMLLLSAFVPFYSAFACQQANIDLSCWQKGWCPVCGQYPVNGYNRCGDGRRILGCWLCETEWTFSRLVCPVCESQRQDGQLLLTPLGGDRVRRIQVCEDCGHYLKITDCTQASNNCDLQVENALTVNLDILAQRKGYRPASHPLQVQQ